MSRDVFEAVRDPAQQVRQIRDEVFSHLTAIRELVADKPSIAARCADELLGMLRDLRYLKGRFVEDAGNGEAEVMI